MMWTLRRRGAAVGSILALAAGIVGPSALPGGRDALGPPRPELVAAELLAGPADEPVDAIVVLADRPAPAQLSRGPAAAVDALRAAAERSQPTLVEQVTRYGGEVLSRLWIQNAVVVRGVPATLLAASGVDGVARIIPNFPVTAPDLTSRASAAHPSAIVDGDRTWGIDRINAHRVWEELGVDGSGVRVATLDTGVDPEHPDLAGKLVSDDPEDPFYPGGWIAFGGGGLPLDIPPVDTHGHGTHVAGTIHGGDSTGVAIGVAPGAEMMHAMVLPGGSGDFANVLAGMQWAAAPYDQRGNPAGRPADVVTMSFGEVGIVEEFIPPIRNLVAAGIVAVVAIGNDCGFGNTASPGNVYESLAVGATDPADDVAGFSCGGTIGRDQWSQPPADWPESYVKPDLSAPGVDVYSAVPGGSHTYLSGTSMATPHVAGTAALMRQADPDLTVGQLRDTLAATAFFDDRHGAERPNSRFGHGRIDAFAAVSAVLPAGGVTGTVVDAATGSSVAGVTVTADGVDRAVTSGPDGRYRLHLEPGAYDLDASRFGYQPASVPGVEVALGSFTEVDIALTPRPTGTVSGLVRYEPTGHGVPGARIEVVDHPVTTTSGADGGFTLSLPEGTYQLRATAPPLRASRPVEVTVTGGAVTEVVLDVRHPGRTQRVDVAADGTPANTASSSPAISADGRFVAFETRASNLVPGDTNGRVDIYVRDRLTGFTERVSVASDGTQSDGDSHRPAISADGRFVAFDSTATNLVDHPGATGIQTYVHDRVTGVTELVSQSTGGQPANDWSRDAAISGDGRYILFGSQATNLVPGAEPGHIYLRDRVEQTTVIASVATGGVPANNTSLGADISYDGTQVSFYSASTNLDDDIRNGVFNVFVHDRTTGQTRRVSLSTDGQESQGGANTQSVISGNGRVVAWDSRAHNLVPDDTNNVYDVFVHDRDTGETTRVSLSSAGDQGDRNSRNPALSGNGRYVAFDSPAANLVEGDTNGAFDVFVHDRLTGQTVRESVTVDGGQANGHSTQQVLDGSGRFVAFHSFATNLLGEESTPNGVYMRDRFGDDGPTPQFVVWNLRVDRAVALSPGPVTVSATVTNVGDADGTYPATLRINGRPVDTDSVVLAPGQSRDVQWTVERTELGTYLVQLGPATASFRIRAPEVDLSVSSLQGAGHVAGPLADASVSLFDGDILVPVGTTDADGRLRFETTAPQGTYSIVVRRSPAADDDLGYLLVQPATVDRDVTITLAPHTFDEPPPSASTAADPAALIDLDLEPVSDRHQAWVYLRHPATGGYGFAFPPGSVVSTVAPPGTAFQAVDVHTVVGLERDWWAVTEVVDDLTWNDPVGYEYRLGGAATAELAARVLDGTEIEAIWTVRDAAGHEFAEFRRTNLRPFATGTGVPPVLELDRVAGTVAELAPRPAEVILRLDDPRAEPVHAGGVDWDERRLVLDLADLADEVPTGTYGLRLEAATGTYSGLVGATASLAVTTPPPPEQFLLVLSGEPDPPPGASVDDVVRVLKDTAERTQRELIARIEAGELGDVRVVNRFWLQNMLLVEVGARTGTTGPAVDARDTLAAVPGVVRVVPNFDVTVIEPDAEAGTMAVVEDRALGVDRISAHRVHRELGLDGTGVRVATLDTGVDATHPDLAGRMVSDRPGDPTHPGGWIEFDPTGHPVASTPHDTAEHGTHVSGTIHGGDTSGVQIGVAPGADLMHALVLPGGRGTFAQVVAGMQWALDPFDATGAPAGRPADVINMSLGAPGLHQEMVTPVRNLRLAGVFPAIAIGNDCPPGGTSSPGNVFEAVAVGATDAADTVADFSCGGRVSSGDWPSPPPDWPATYVKPDLTAPGVGVYSSLPGGGYGVFSGTSMATPHVAGTVALLLQADPDATVDDLVEHLAATAFYDGRHGPERPNPRFGHGRVDAYAAALRVAVDSGVTGVVRDAATGAPVAGATVESLTTGVQVTTGEDGAFQLRLTPGVHDLSVTVFGYEPAVVDGVEVTPDTFTRVDVELERTPWGSLEGTVVLSGSSHGVPGVEVTVEGTPLRVHTGADGRFTVPAVPVGEYQLRAAPRRLPAPPPVTVTVEEGGTTTVDLQVEPPPVTVGLLGDRNGSIGQFLAEHGIPSEPIDWQADVSRYGAIVVNQPGDPGREVFLDFLAATDAAGVGVIFHDTWSSLGNGIELLNRHTGNPAVRGRGFSGAIDFLYYEVTAAHPVVDGFDVGDRVVLNSRTSTREHAWFDGYEGDGRMVVADAARNDLGVVGRGIGVQQRENSRHVLLSMHATGSIIRTDDWGPDGKRVFLNALEWVTPDREGGFPVMVPWGLAVDPGEVLAGEPAQVSVNVTNVGTGAGDYEAVLTVDGEGAGSEVVTLGAGETTTVTWTLTLDQLGTYQVAVADLTASLRVRAPRVDLSVSTLAGPGHDPAPMPGATVELIDQGQRIPLGTTGEAGTLAFETTRAAGDYTIVVRRPATAVHDLAYLLATQVRVDADTAVRVAPQTLAGGHASGQVTNGDPAAVVWLHADPVANGDRAWTFLRHPLAAPHAYAFPPGPVVTTVADAPFQAAHVHAVTGLERDWWAVTRVVDDLKWTEPVEYGHRFGGQATSRLAPEWVDGTRFRVTWSATDAYGHTFRQLSSTRLRSFDTVDVSVPDALPLEQVAEVVASRAPVAAEVVLRLSGPDGEPVHAGGVGWDQPSLVRDLADLVPEVTDGVYPLGLEIEAGAFGRLAAGGTLVVDTTGPVLDWRAPADGQGFLDPEITVAGTVTDATSGVSQVLVNGHPALLDADGTWQLRLRLDPGENLITVTAVDHHGNRTTETRTVALLGYSATWHVPSGSPAVVPVQLRIVDPDGRAVFAGPVELTATGSGGDTYGPFEMDWRGQHYQYLLRDLPPDRYRLTADLEVEGWHVELAGPVIDLPDRDPDNDGSRLLCCEGEVLS